MNSEALEYLQEVCLSKITPKDVEELYGLSSVVRFFADELLKGKKEIECAKEEVQMLRNLLLKDKKK